MKSVVEAKGLVKRFADRNVVDSVSFEVPKGECFGILGPNGAGKSTLMKMMYGSSSITSGELYILGLNIKKNFREIKSRIGVIPQEDSLDVEFNVFENLILQAQYHGIDAQISVRRSEELLRLFRLEDEKNQDIGKLSGGMKRRLAVAKDLINRPDLIFLDEPTSGLDPKARTWIWDFLLKIKEEMGTLVLTTHYMEEAERLCDRVAIMDNGKILAIGSPAELIAKNIGLEVVDFEVRRADLGYYMERLKAKGNRYLNIGSTISVYFNETNQAKEILSLVSSEKLTIRKPSLNDVFMKLAGHELRQEPL